LQSRRVALGGARDLWAETDSNHRRAARRRPPPSRRPTAASRRTQPRDPGAQFRARFRGRRASARQRRHAARQVRWRICLARIASDAGKRDDASSVARLRSVRSADSSAGLADGGSGHAAASDHGPTRAAADRDLRDYPVRLRNRRGGHCLRRSCDGQGKAGNRNQSDHSSPPFFTVAFLILAVAGLQTPGHGLAKGQPIVLLLC